MNGARERTLFPAAKGWPRASVARVPATPPGRPRGAATRPDPGAERRHRRIPGPPSTSPVFGSFLLTTKAPGLGLASPGHLVATTTSTSFAASKLVEDALHRVGTLKVIVADARREFLECPG